jgi:hypothetical protein
VKEATLMGGLLHTTRLSLCRADGRPLGVCGAAGKWTRVLRPFVGGSLVVAYVVSRVAQPGVAAGVVPALPGGAEALAWPLAHGVVRIGIRSVTGSSRATALLTGVLTAAAVWISHRLETWTGRPLGEGGRSHEGLDDRRRPRHTSHDGCSFEDLSSAEAVVLGPCLVGHAATSLCRAGTLYVRV